MGLNTEQYLDFFYGEYRKKGIFIRKFPIELRVYPSRLDGMGFMYLDYVLGENTEYFDISFDAVLKVYAGKIGKEDAMIIEHRSVESVVTKKVAVAILGLSDIDYWINLVENAREAYAKRKRDEREELLRVANEKEQSALNFYRDCYSFHIGDSTPIYWLFSEKNIIVAIYIGSDHSLNFLKIDGYRKEEYHLFIDLCYN